MLVMQIMQIHSVPNPSPPVANPSRGDQQINDFGQS